MYSTKMEKLNKASLEFILNHAATVIVVGQYTKSFILMIRVNLSKLNQGLGLWIEVS